MILLLLSCVSEPEPPLDGPPAAGAAHRTWRGERAFRHLGRFVSAAPLVGSGPLVVSDADYNNDVTSWRLEPNAQSGPVAGAATGRLEGVSSGQFIDDLDGDGAPEVRADNGPLQEVLLFDADRPGVVTPGEAWLRGGHAALGDPWRGVVGTPDLDGDGQSDLSVTFRDRVTTWFGPLDPATFELDAPNATTLVPEGAALRGIFGLRRPSGAGALLASWDVPDDDDGQLSWVEPDQSLSEAVTIDAGTNLVAIGELDAEPGEDVLLRGVGRVEVESYTLSDTGVVATGVVVEATLGGFNASVGVGASGDFDGDGAVDLAVVLTSGAVYVLRGPLAPGTTTLDDADVQVRSGVADDDFGASLAAADVDGDGRADLLVGAPMDSGLAREGGAAYLWRGVDLFP
jgi:hypothetical protein